MSGGRYPFLPSTSTAAGSGEGIGHAFLIIVSLEKKLSLFPKNIPKKGLSSENQGSKRVVSVCK